MSSTSVIRESLSTDCNFGSSLFEYQNNSSITIIDCGLSTCTNIVECVDQTNIGLTNCEELSRFNGLINDETLTNPLERALYYLYIQ